MQEDSPDTNNIKIDNNIKGDNSREIIIWANLGYPFRFDSLF